MKCDKTPTGSRLEEKAASKMTCRLEKDHGVLHEYMSPNKMFWLWVEDKYIQLVDAKDPDEKNWGELSLKSYY